MNAGKLPPPNYCLSLHRQSKVYAKAKPKRGLRREKTPKQRRSCRCFGSCLSRSKSARYFCSCSRPAALLAGEWVDACLTLLIVAASSAIGTWREFDAGRAIEKLKSLVVAKARVLRDGQSVQIPSSQVVPGDVVLLAAGSLIPADGLLLWPMIFVSQALLTGESLPVEKHIETEPQLCPPLQRKDAVFQGTTVRSGSATFVVLATGRKTFLARSQTN